MTDIPHLRKLHGKATIDGTVMGTGYAQKVLDSLPALLDEIERLRAWRKAVCEKWSGILSIEEGPIVYEGAEVSDDQRKPHAGPEDSPS